MKLTQKTPPQNHNGNLPPQARFHAARLALKMLFFLFLAAAPVAAQTEQNGQNNTPAPAISSHAEPLNFSIVSWNLQTFGHVEGERADVCRQAYAAVISTEVYVMSVQEIAHENGMKTFLKLMPEGGKGWGVSFQDTPDSQDNAILYRTCCATVTAQGFLFTDPETGIPDKDKALHPVRLAHIKAGNFDFTILSLHLTFHEGNAESSRKELMAVLDWLTNYLRSPENDPDVIIAGDFNLPSAAGKTLSKRRNVKKWLTLESIISAKPEFAEGPHKLTVLVDEPTSRPNKKPQNNYDHFIVTPGMLAHIKNAGRMSAATVDATDAGVHSRVSDHYPVEALISP